MFLSFHVIWHRPFRVMFWKIIEPKKPHIIKCWAYLHPRVCVPVLLCFAPLSFIPNTQSIYRANIFAHRRVIAYLAPREYMFLSTYSVTRRWFRWSPSYTGTLYQWTYAPEMSSTGIWRLWKNRRGGGGGVQLYASSEIYVRRWFSLCHDLCRIMGVMTLRKQLMSGCVRYEESRGRDL